MILNLPPYNCKISTQNGKRYIFDPIRKRNIVVTPEEWVRQHFVAFLISHKGVPAGRMGNEVSLLHNGNKRRCDTVIYNNTANPCAIVEYKAPSITINQDVFDQIVRYNMVLQVDYLIVSNGINHYCCKIDKAAHSYQFLQDIPNYNDML